MSATPLLKMYCRSSIDKLKMKEMRNDFLKDRIPPRQARKIGSGRNRMMFPMRLL